MASVYATGILANAISSGYVSTGISFGGKCHHEDVSKGGWRNALRTKASTDRPPKQLTMRSRDLRVGAGAGPTYRDAGVDNDSGSELLRRIVALAPGIGGFGGRVSFGDSYLVANTHGVGTKLKLAFELDKHETIGIDLVAMSVNDIVTAGASPLFFLDYFATSHLDVDQAEQVIKGIVDGCRQADCVLIGGETAEMPNFYAKGVYDLSDFAVGSVKKDALVDGKDIKVGDQIIGLASSGPHSNGFSLVHRVVAKSRASLKDLFPGAEGISIGEALLAPTVIYVKQVLELVAKGEVKGIAHITGGGFTYSIPRIFPPGLGAFVKVHTWNVPPIFKWLQRVGCIEEAEMFRTFNMGIGMILVVSPHIASDILSTYTNTSLLGNVVEGEGVKYSEAFRTEASSYDKEAKAQKQVEHKSRTRIENIEVGPGSSLTYKDAGVDINAGSELVRRIAALNPDIGGFGGLFPFGDSYLVAGTDGVGTKLKLAFELDIHNTIGIDLVAMSVNDVVTSGAKPIFFLDYFATSHLYADQAEQVIKGIVDGCHQADCVFLGGGKTVEMPNFYVKGEYDVSGFAVGSVKKDALVDGKDIKVGDQIIGLASSGPHSNGFSLVHRVVAKSRASLEDPLPGAEGTRQGISIGEALLAPTVIYVKQVLELVAKGAVKGIAHITGGGFTYNIPRIFPPGLGAFVNVTAWSVPPIFQWLQSAGGIEDAEMFRTFNMGIGMILVVDPNRASDILSMYANTTLLGHVLEGEGVTYGS